MSSDPFRLLGLDPRTATDADVRKAYAERLKRTRPEDDRAGFMALRAAFEQARERVRQRETYGDDPYDDYEDEPEAEAGADAATEPLMEMTAEAPEAPEDEDEAEDYSDAMNRTMTALIDALTGAPFGPSVKRVMAIVEADDVAGIEDYQALQWQVRQLLCDRTGYYLEPQELRVPDWLRLDVFDALDGYFGWSRQPALQPWVRGLNDWLVRVRKRIVWNAMPKAEQDALRMTARERSGAIPDGPATENNVWATPDDGGKSGFGWLAMAGGIIGYAIFQFVMRVSGNS